MNVPAYGLLATTTAIFVVAASVSRIYAVDGRTFILLISMLLYVIGNLLMVQVMRAFGLGVAVSLSTIAQLIFINLSAFLFFQERPSSIQIAGIVLGAVGMVLILLPAGER